MSDTREILVGTAQCPEGDADCWFKDLEDEQIARLASIAGLGPRQTKSNKSLRDLTREELLKGLENFAVSFNFTLADMRECASKVLLKTDTLETQQALFKTCIVNASTRKLEPSDTKALSKLPDGIGTITLTSKSLQRNLALVEVGDAKTMYGNAGMNTKKTAAAVASYAESEMKLQNATKDVESMPTKSQFVMVQLLQIIKRHFQSLLTNIENVMQESEFFNEERLEEIANNDDENDWDIRRMLRKAGRAIKDGFKFGVKSLWNGVKFVAKLGAQAAAMFASSPLAMSILTHPGIWWMILKSVNMMKSILCHKLMIYLGVYKEIKPKTFYETASGLAGSAYNVITEAAPFAILNIIENGGWSTIWDVSGKFAFLGLKMGANFLPFGGVAAGMMLDGLEKIASTAVQGATESLCFIMQYTNIASTFLDILDIRTCFAAPPGFE